VRILIGFRTKKKSVIHESEESLIESTVAKPVESLSGNMKSAIVYLNNSELQFTNCASSYVPIVVWLKDSIWLDGVEPYIEHVQERKNVSSILSKVSNVLKGHGYNGYIPLDTTASVVSDSPTKAKVEVKLL